MLADFQNSFTPTISGKFAMQQSLTISSHRKRVATLPCENFENRPIFDEVMCRAFGVHFFGQPCISVYFMLRRCHARTLQYRKLQCRTGTAHCESKIRH